MLARSCKFGVNILCLLLFSCCITNGLQCGTYDCGGTDSCCNDAVMGPVCFNPATSTCVANSGASGFKLCGAGLGSCGDICYNTAGYYCCNGQITQNGQPCPVTSSTPTQPANNCPAAGGQPGVNCPAGTTCCGDGTMTPSCIPNGGTKKCCRWYLSSTQCDLDQVCGGDLGSGASSSALCGPAGSTFCNNGFVDNTFCSADQHCCGLYGQTAFCCATGSACNNATGTCVAPATPTPTHTVKPTATHPATTHAATTPKPNNCPGAAGTAGVNCPSGTTCCGSGTMTPSCVTNGGSKKCCVWYLSSTQCDLDQVCGGDLGSGASSTAVCGPSGSTFCNNGFVNNAFCTADQHCCGLYGQNSFCCATGSACNNATGTCVAPPTPTPTHTVKATHPATTHAATTPKPNNCPGAAETAGVNCPSGTSCCGSDTMTPSCVASNSGKQCCTWYLASTQCNATQVCGGELGPGASSNALCGPPGSQFCNMGFGTNTFCGATDVCCGNQDVNAFCCPEGSTCDNTNNQCIAPTPTPTPTPAANNCPGAANSAGVNCPAGTTCCGDGTMTPSCVADNSDKQCCTWYLASTQCNSTQVCGGGGGYGASSYALCGPPGSQFCNYGDAPNTFCAADQVCCGIYSSAAWCCNSGQTCDTATYSCSG